MQNRTSLLFLLAAGSALLAQTATGNVSGRVLTPQGTPLAGVRLILESPALFTPRQVTTDAEGRYRVSLLPVGYYTFKVYKDGYLGKTLTAYRVGVGTETAQDFVLKPAEVAETKVEVTASASAMEAKSADRVAYNYSAEQLATLPVSRTFTGVASLTPGAYALGYTNGEFRIRGGSTNQTLYRVDGTDVKSDTYGVPVYNVLPDSVEDIQIITSAGNARFGRALGGAAQVVTRQGGNAFQGTYRAWYSRKSWSVADVFGRPQYRLDDFTPDASSRQHDVTLSGPVLKDRLWFYLGYRFAPSVSQIFRTAYRADPTINQVATTYGVLPNVDTVLKRGPGLAGYTVDLMDSDTMLYGSARRHKAELKLTLKVTEDHTVSSTYMEEIRSYLNGDYLPGNVINREFYGNQEVSRQSASAVWRGVLSPSWYFEANVSQATYATTPFQGPKQNPVPVFSYLSNGAPSSATARSFGTYLLNDAAPIEDQRERNSRMEVNFRGYLDFHGSHDLDIGAERYANAYNPGTYFGDRRVTNGGWYKGPGANLDASNYLFPTLAWVDTTSNGQRWGTALAPIMRRYWGVSGSGKNRSQGLWINDTWTPNKHVTAMLGLRFSRFSMADTDGRIMGEASQLEPRFSLKWDPRGTGVDTLAFSLYRQASGYLSSLSSSLMTTPTSTSTTHGWRGIGNQPLPNTPNDLVGGLAMYGVRWVTYAQLTDPAHYPALPYAYSDNRQLIAANGLRPSIADEMALTYRRSYEGGFVSLAVTERKYRRDVLSYSDYSWDGYTRVNDPSGGGAPSKLQSYTRYLNSPFSYAFRTAELGWQERISSRISWGGAYTYMWSDPGPGSAPFQDRTVITDPRNALPEGQSYAPTGPGFANDHNVRFWATYQQPLGKGGRIVFTLMGSMYSHRKGSYGYTKLLNYNALDPKDPVHNPDKLQVVDSQAGYNFPAWVYTEGAGHYKGSWDTRNLDLKIEWEIPLYRSLRLIGGLTVTNLLNASQWASLGYTGEVINSNSYGFQEGRSLRDYYYFTNGKWPVGTNWKPTDQGIYGYNAPRGISALDERSALEGGFSIGLRF